MFEEDECTEKITLEEWRGVYVGVRAAPAPPHIPVLFSRLTFYSGVRRMEKNCLRGERC